MAATSLPVAEAVVDGVTGPHTVGASPAELLLLVRDLLAHPSTAAAGQDRICGRYSWPRIAGETVRVYERALAARTASDPGRPTRQVG